MKRETFSNRQLQKEYARFTRWKKKYEHPDGDRRFISDTDHASRPYVVGSHQGLDKRSTFRPELWNIVWASDKLLTRHLIGLHAEILRHYNLYCETNHVSLKNNNDDYLPLGKIIANSVSQRITGIANETDNIQFLWGLKFAYDASGDAGIELIFNRIPHLFTNEIPPEFPNTDIQQFQQTFGENGINDPHKDSTTHCPFHSFSQVLAYEVDLVLTELSFVKFDAKSHTDKRDAENAAESLSAELRKQFIITVNQLITTYSREEKLPVFPSFLRVLGQIGQSMHIFTNGK